MLLERKKKTCFTPVHFAVEKNDSDITKWETICAQGARLWAPAHSDTRDNVLCPAWSLRQKTHAMAEFSVCLNSLTAKGLHT